MLDFSCVLTTKNHTFKFDSEANLTIDGHPHRTKVNDYSKNVLYHKFSVKEAVDVATVLLNRVKEIKSKQSKPIFSAKSFDEVVNRIKLAEKVREVLIDVRLCNVSNSWRSNLKEKLELEIHCAINNLYEGDYAYSDSITLPQNIVLDSLTTKRFFRSVSRSDFDDIYDPILNSKTKMEALCKDLLGFNYAKYGVDKTEIHKAINNAYAETLKAIDAYNFILKELGSPEEIISASQSKISRRLNTAKIGVSYWQISHWLTEYSNYLKDNGHSIKKKEKKSSLQVTIEKFDKNKETLTQEELLRLFKNKYESQKTLEYMTWDTLKSILTSDLKCVKDQVFDRWKLSDTGEYLVEVSCGKAPVDKESFDLIRTFLARHKAERSFDWEYVQKCESFISSDYLVAYIKDNSLVKDIPKSFYEKRLVSLPIPTVVDLRPEITKEFVSRLNEEDKISILPRLGDEFLDFKNNSVIFIMCDSDFDNIKDVEFDLKDIPELYSNVSWEKIKHIVDRNPKLRRSMINLVLKNKDKEVAETLIMEDLSSLEGESIISLCNLVQDLDKNIQAFVKNSRSNYYGGHDKVISKIFKTETAITALFENAVKNSCKSLIDSILEVVRTNSSMLSSLKKNLISNSPTTFKLTESTLKYLLDSNTKKHLLKVGTHLEKENNYGYDYDYKLESFFQNMRRKDLIEVLGENLSESEYSIYLAPYMTDEEKEISSNNKNFVRKNLEHLPTSVLVKFKDKKVFKDLVGDLRNTKNSRVADRLNKLLTTI